MRTGVAFVMASMLLVGVACDDTSGTSDSYGDTGGVLVPEDPSTAYKMAVIDGDPGKEAAFQRAIDCIMASGIKGAETEEKVGDTLYASWVEGGKPDTLLEWAQAFC